MREHVRCHALILFWLPLHYFSRLRPSESPLRWNATAFPRAQLGVLALWTIVRSVHSKPSWKARPGQGTAQLARLLPSSTHSTPDWTTSIFPRWVTIWRESIYTPLLGHLISKCLHYLSLQHNGIATIFSLLARTLALQSFWFRFLLLNPEIMSVSLLWDLDWQRTIWTLQPSKGPCLLCYCLALVDQDWYRAHPLQHQTDC